MNYEEWGKSVPEAIRGDTLWKVEVYRLGLLLSDLAWYDTTKLMRDKRTLDLADQVYEAIGSVSANVAEGYSRGSNKDRARFYEYSLGSARESRDWYYKGRYVLGEQITDHRLHFLVSVIRLLLKMVPEQRGHTLRDQRALYQINEDGAVAELNELLRNIPLPD